MFFSNLLDTLKQSLKTPSCHGCSRPIPGTVNHLAYFCAQCEENLQFQPAQPLWQTSLGKDRELLRAFAATRLSARTKQQLYGYKFYDRQENLPWLSQVLIHGWQRVEASQTTAFCHPEQTLVMPVPNHYGSKDRMTALASRFAKAFHFDLSTQHLGWVRECPPQHQLRHRRERLHNLLGGMALWTGETKSLTGYRRVILIDDLTTTGATLREAARAVYDGWPAPKLPVVEALAMTSVRFGEPGRV